MEKIKHVTFEEASQEFSFMNDTTQQLVNAVTANILGSIVSSQQEMFITNNNSNIEIDNTHIGDEKDLMSIEDMAHVILEHTSNRWDADELITKRILKDICQTELMSLKSDKLFSDEICDIIRRYRYSKTHLEKTCKSILSNLISSGKIQSTPRPKITWNL
jgi:hypothetical protein